MTLTRKQRNFLEISARPGAVIKKIRPLGRMPYWWVADGADQCQLPEADGYALSTAKLIHRSGDGASLAGGAPYSITDAGRAHLGPD